MGRPGRQHRYERQGSRQAEHAAHGRRDGVQEGHVAGACANFNAQIQVLDIPGEIKIGYSPIGFVRCGRAACRVSKILWKIGKETGGKKMEEPHSMKSNEMAECTFTPQQPLVVDTFKNCEGLSRIAFLDGNGVVMLGKIVAA